MLLPKKKPGKLLKAHKDPTREARSPDPEYVPEYPRTNHRFGGLAADARNSKNLDRGSKRRSGPPGVLMNGLSGPGARNIYL